MHDALGNVILLGSPLRAYGYSDWGAQTLDVDQVGYQGLDRSRWKGALRFAPGGVELYFMRHRWYEPRTGRFLSPDPLGFAGGPNLYAFAAGDPVNFADPSGLKSCIQDPSGCFTDLRGTEANGDGGDGDSESSCLSETIKVALSTLEVIPAARGALVAAKGVRLGLQGARLLASQLAGAARRLPSQTSRYVQLLPSTVVTKSGEAVLLQNTLLPSTMAGVIKSQETGSWSAVEFATDVAVSLLVPDIAGFISDAASLAKCVLARARNRSK